MLRAAIVVLDFFDGVPVTVTQSPAASELTASETVLENCVVVVQLTVVWPELGFCTSMLDPWSAATLPEASRGRSEWMLPLRRRTDHRGGHQRRHSSGQETRPASATRASAGQCLHVECPSLLSLAYSFRRASIGARAAARLAGYTPKATPMARRWPVRRPRPSGSWSSDRRSGRAGRSPEDPAGDAECAADQSQDGRLDEELTPDDPGRGTERLAQADLTDAFGDRDQHDVHDADAAHDQRDGGDAAEQDRERVVDRRGGRMSDCSEVIVKSASPRLVIPWSWRSRWSASW